MKPNACVSELTENIFGKIKDYSSRDTVVIMFSENNIVNFKYLNILLRNVLPLGKFTNVLLLTKCDWRTKSNYISFICNKINNFCKLNNNISIHFSGQIKYRNDRQCKINACHKIVGHITGNTYKIAANNIVIKTIDVMTNPWSKIVNSNKQCTSSQIIDLEDQITRHNSSNNSDNNRPTNCRQTAEITNVMVNETAINTTSNFLYPRLSQIQLTT